MGKPLISVIIPAFNVAHFIAHALDSVYKQTYPNVEVIVVDDGSTDETVHVIRKCSPEPLIIKQENRGLPSARNAGIKASTGTYLAFLDADDRWLPNKLEKQFAFSKQHPDVSVFLCNLINFEGNKQKGRRFSSTKIFGRAKAEGIVRDYIKPKVRYAFHAPSSLLVRKTVLDKYGLFDESLRSGADSDMILRWVLAGEGIGYQDDGLVLYETNNPDSLRKDFSTWSNSHFRYWFKAEEYGIPENIRSDFETMRKLTLLNSCFGLILKGAPNVARQHLKAHKKNLFGLRWYCLLALSFMPFAIIARYNKVRQFVHNTALFKKYKQRR